MLAREVRTLGAWPALDLLRIDLSGAKISQPTLPGKVGDGVQPCVTTKRFELEAAPAEVNGMPIHISLHAEDAAFEFVSLEGGQAMLAINQASHGELSAHAAHSDLDRLIHSLVSAAAREHGAEIKSVALRFTSRGPRAVSINAEVTAKMFIATTKLGLSGDADLDDKLNARLSNLRFQGDGMMANLAGGFIRPKLASFEGRTFPLMNFALGEITLRDVQLEAGETLRLSAQFGS